MIHVLGIDAGGTKTVCLLADEEGQIVAEARGGGANLQAVGELEVEKVLHRVMEDAIGSRSVVPSVICLGIAGVDRPDDSAVVGAIMRRIGTRRGSSSSMMRWLRSRRAPRVNRALSSSLELDPFCTDETRKEKPRVRAAGDTCSATREAVTGSDAPRSGQSCDKPIDAAP